MSKITERRNKRIKEAAARGDWKEVLRLLDQQLENAQRRDRYHHLKSTDYQISERNTSGDAMLVDNNTPLELLIQAEQRHKLNAALERLDDTNRQIVLNRVNGKSYSSIAKIVNLTDKPVKTRYEKAIRHLKDILKDFFE